MAPLSDQYISIGIGFALAVFIFYVVQVAKRMKALVAVKVKRTVYGMIILVGVANFLRAQGYSTNVAAILAMIPALLPLWFVRTPRASRYIPAGMKRRVLEREHGQVYDGRQMHLDHIVPLAKGGDTSIENLRVLSKEANLKKGAKMPRPWDFV